MLFSRKRNRKFAGGSAQAAGFDAANRNNAPLLCRNEDGEIQDAILLGTNQFFAVNKKDGAGSISHTISGTDENLPTNGCVITRCRTAESRCRNRKVSYSNGHAIQK